MKTYYYIIQGIKRLFDVQIPRDSKNEYFKELNEFYVKNYNQEITPLTDRDYLLCLV